MDERTPTPTPVFDDPGVCRDGKQELEQATSGPRRLGDMGLVRPFELDRSEAAFPFAMLDGTELLCHIAWPDPESVLAFFQTTDVRFEERAGRRRVLVRDPEEVYNFFAAHFKRLTYLDGSDLDPKEPDKQLALILDNREWQIPQAILWNQLFEVTVLPPRKAESGKLNLAAIAQDRSVRLRIRSWDQAHRLMLTHVVTVHFEKLSHLETEAYMKAANVRDYIERVEEWSVRTDCQKLDEIFCKRVTSVDGMTYKGEPLADGQKGRWLDRWLFCWTKAALGGYHQGVIAKND